MHKMIMHVEGGKFLVHGAVPEIFKTWATCVVWRQDTVRDLIFSSPYHKKQSLLYKRKNPFRMSLRIFWITQCRLGKQ
jgi:hypothetical protein